jgi:hypothetical protein
MDNSLNDNQNNRSSLGLVKMDREKGINENDKVDDLVPADEIQVKHEWYVRSSTIAKIFFKNEYRLICIFVPQPSSLCKTNILCLTIFRLAACFSICGLLSPDNSESGNEEVSSTVYSFINIIYNRVMYM